MLIENNILPLNMVKSEIDITLGQIETCLEAFDENRSAVSHLKQTAEHCKQLQGVFEMISLPGASLLCEAMALATEKILQQSDLIRDETLAKISNAVVVLVHYLEYVQLTQNGLPELLFVNINDLRSVFGAKQLTESYFFNIDLKSLDLGKLKTIEKDIADGNVSRRLRHMYQVGLLGSFKEENLKTNYQMMARALKRLNGLYQNAHGSLLLRICNGVLEALLEGNISLNKTRKLMLGRIDRQIKQLLNQQESEVDEAALLTLIKDCLYIIALSEPNTALIKELQNEFGLEQFNLNEQVIQQERELMTGPSASVIRTVSAALREEISSMKDQLDVLSRAGDKAAELKGKTNDLRKIAHTLVMLGLPAASKRLNNLLDTLSGTEHFEKNIADVADTLVYIEQAIAGLERNNTPIQTLNKESTQDQPIELERVYSTVVKESRQGLSEVQRLVSDFVANKFDANILASVPDILHSSWGGISFLNIDRAAALIEQSARFIKEKLLSSEAQAVELSHLHTLADALASIDYYLESFEDKKPVNESVLDIAEESLVELGYQIA